MQNTRRSPEFILYMWFASFEDIQVGANSSSAAAQMKKVVEKLTGRRHDCDCRLHGLAGAMTLGR